MIVSLPSVTEYGQGYIGFCAGVFLPEIITAPPCPCPRTFSFLFFSSLAARSQKATTERTDRRWFRWESKRAIDKRENRYGKLVQTSGADLLTSFILVTCLYPTSCSQVTNWNYINRILPETKVIVQTEEFILLGF